LTVAYQSKKKELEMLKATKTLLVTALLYAAALPVFASGSKPTVVLVHGAFADASSWSGVIS